MIDLSKIKKYLRQELSEKRYRHSINVSKVAVELASKYGCDMHKSEIAGLVHDCTRKMSKDIQLQYIKRLGIELDDTCKHVEELLHAISGVYVCRELFQIDDEEILLAVRYHTTGRADMTLLEKIIFVADFIEPLRSFQGVEEIRNTAFADLDKAILLALNFTIKYIISIDRSIHSDSIAARNFILHNIQI